MNESRCVNGKATLRQRPLARVDKHTPASREGKPVEKTDAVHFVRPVARRSRCAVVQPFQCGWRRPSGGTGADPGLFVGKCRGSQRGALSSRVRGGVQRRHESSDVPARSRRLGRDQLSGEGLREVRGEGWSRQLRSHGDSGRRDAARGDGFATGGVRSVRVRGGGGPHGPSRSMRARRAVVRAPPSRAVIPCARDH